MAYRIAFEQQDYQAAIYTTRLALQESAPLSPGKSVLVGIWVGTRIFPKIILGSSNSGKATGKNGQMMEIVKKSIFG